MNQLSFEKTMSIKDIAEFTGRDRETVRAHTEKLYPNLLVNGVKTELNEMQASDVLKSIRIKDTPNLQKNLQVLTKVDEDKIIDQAFALLHKRQQENLEIIKNLKSANTKMLPKAEFYDTVTSSKDTINMSDVAAVLNIKKLGQNNLYKFLRDKKILNRNNRPYRQYIEAGYFKCIENTFTSNTNQVVHVTLKTVVYQKGIDFIRKQIKEN